MARSLTTIAPSLSTISFGGIPRGLPNPTFGNPPITNTYSSIGGSGALGSGISPLIFILPILFSVLPLLLSGLQSLFSSGRDNENSSCKNNQNNNNSNSNGCQRCGQQSTQALERVQFNYNDSNNYAGGGR
jgi:hypothetical protein